MKKIIYLAAAAALMFTAACGTSGSSAETAAASSEAAGSSRKIETMAPAETKTAAETAASAETTAAAPAESSAAPAGTAAPAETETAAPAETAVAPEKPETKEAVSLELLAENGYEFDSMDVADPNNEHYPWVQLYSSEWQTFHLPEDLKKQYPALDASLEKFNKNLNNAMDRYKREYSAEARDYFASDPGWFEPFVANETLCVRRADSRVVSFEQVRTLFRGGAHQDYLYGGQNFDAETGESIALTDVVTDIQELKEVLAEHIIRDYGSELLVEVPEVFKEYDAESFHWTLDQEGVTFYFSPYELSYFAMGMLPAYIRFDENPELFTGKYTEAPEEYIAEFSEYERFLRDADGDGKTDEIQVTCDADEYGTMEKVHILLNGKDYPFEYYGFSARPSFVSGEDGNSFLMIESVMENDYHSLYFFRFTKNGVEAAEEYSGRGSGYCYYPEEETAFQAVLSDPENMLLESNFDIMGTYSANARHRLDKGGNPVRTDALWEVGYDRTVTSLKDLDLEVLKNPEDTGKGTIETIPRGTVFHFRYTDGETYLNTVTDDGKAVRLQPVQVDWEWKIDGENIEDVFENVMFAG